jgi:hypothetical protein
MAGSRQHADPTDEYERLLFMHRVVHDQRRYHPLIHQQFESGQSIQGFAERLWLVPQPFDDRPEGGGEALPLPASTASRNRCFTSCCVFPAKWTVYTGG